MNFFSKTVRFGALAVVGAVLIFEPGCGDTFRPIAYPIPTPGGDPGSIGSITVINCNGTTSRTGSLMSCAGTARSNSQQINISGDSITLSTDIGVAPGRAGYDVNRGAYYVPNTSTDSMTYVGLTGTPTTLTLPAGSNPIVAVPGSTEEYVLNAGSGSVAANLSVIALTTNAISASYPVGSTPVYGVTVGNNVYVLDKTLNQVNVYSTQQQKFVASIAVGASPVYALPSYDRNYVYVLNQGDSTLTIIDANALTAIATISTGGTGPVAAFLDRSLIRLYVVNQGDNTVTSFSAINNSSLTQLGTATVGPSPVNVTVLTGGERAYTANSGSNTLSEITTGSMTVAKTLTVGTDPSARVTDVTSSADGLKAYAATVTTGDLNNGVTVIRTSDDVVMNNLASPKKDPNCITSTASPCPLQQPQQFIAGR